MSAPFMTAHVGTVWTFLRCNPESHHRMDLDESEAPYLYRQLF